MKIFNSSDEIIEAIETCEDKAEVSLAIKALVNLASHDRKLDKDDFPSDSLAGSVLISTMMLALKAM